MAVNLSMDKRRQAKLEEQLTEIRERPENKKCMDCTEKYPKMFNTTHNTVVCGNCAVIHREFGHRIKALTQHTFEASEVEKLDKGGNQVARDTYLVGWKNQIYREPLPTDTSRVREFMKMKYIEKRWYKPYTGPLQRPTEPEEEEEEEEEEVDTRQRSVSAPPAPAPGLVAAAAAIPPIDPIPNDVRNRSQSYTTNPPPQFPQQTQPAVPLASAVPLQPAIHSLPQQSQQYNQTSVQSLISQPHLTAHNQILNPDQWRQVQAQQQVQLQELQLKQQQQQELLKQQHAQQQAQLQQQIQQQQIQQIQQTQQQQQLLQQQQAQLQYQQQQQQQQYQQEQQRIQQQQQQLAQQQQQLQQQLHNTQSTPIQSFQPQAAPQQQFPQQQIPQQQFSQQPIPQQQFAQQPIPQQQFAQQPIPQQQFAQPQQQFAQQPIPQQQFAQQQYPQQQFAQQQRPVQQQPAAAAAPVSYLDFNLR